MFEVDVKNVTKGRREGKEEDQLGFVFLIDACAHNMRGLACHTSIPRAEFREHSASGSAVNLIP